METTRRGFLAGAAGMAVATMGASVLLDADGKVVQVANAMDAHPDVPAKAGAITVSQCQCRLMWEGLGVPFPEDHPRRTCLSLGEMAEYFIEQGIGEQITQDEAIKIYEDAIDAGMVIESIATKDADIMCICSATAAHAAT